MIKLVGRWFIAYRRWCTAGEWNWFVYFRHFILFCCSFRRTGRDPGLHFWEIVIFFLKASRHQGKAKKKKTSADYADKMGRHEGIEGRRRE